MPSLIASPPTYHTGTQSFQEPTPQIFIGTGAKFRTYIVLNAESVFTEIQNLI